MKKLSILKDNIFEEIDYEINSNGFVVIEDFTSKNDDFFKRINNIYERTIFDGFDDSYQGGFCKRFENFSFQEKNSKEMISIWSSNHIIKSIVFKYFNNNDFKMDVFETLDTPKSKHIAQDPHFDRFPTLKFLIYLNDIDVSNGAFCVSPGSHHWVRKNFPLPRERFNNIKYFKDSRNLPKFVIDNLIPITGRAGQLLVFHTDCVHNQGIVHTGDSKIIRAHFRDSFKYVIKEQNFLRLKMQKLVSKFKIKKNKH